MGERPKVETARRLVKRTLFGRRIEQVAVADDPVVCDRASPAEVRPALTGRTAMDARRERKYFRLALDQPPHPVFHFGMSGRLVIDREGETPPKYCELAITVSDRTAVAITGVRRLRLAQDPEFEYPSACWASMR